MCSAGLCGNAPNRAILWHGGVHGCREWRHMPSGMRARIHGGRLRLGDLHRGHLDRDTVLAQEMHNGADGAEFQARALAVRAARGRQLPARLRGRLRAFGGLRLLAGWPFFIAPVRGEAVRGEGRMHERCPRRGVPDALPPPRSGGRWAAAWRWRRRRRKRRCRGGRAGGHRRGVHGRGVGLSPRRLPSRRGSALCGAAACAERRGSRRVR
mmetsp:Transcript_30899/g.98564  ORF Transcript_30899/g.98564 Transcript_30899/m.98564 type:complete len:211 (-) Transcript_30899:404-1036(-)